MRNICAGNYMSGHILRSALTCRAGNGPNFSVPTLGRWKESDTLPVPITSLSIGWKTSSRGKGSRSLGPRSRSGAVM